MTARRPKALYHISHRNPNSTYHLSLGISYPNDEDVAYAEALGKRPGGDIFIHGRPRKNWGEYSGTTGPPAASRSPTTRWKRSMPWSATGTPILILP